MASKAKAEGMPRDRGWDPAKARIEATRRMVGNYDEWPKWPLLPMKHESKMDRGARMIGVMTEEDSDTYNIYLYNMYDKVPRLKGDIPEEKIMRFTSVDALIDDGWRVD